MLLNNYFINTDCVVAQNSKGKILWRRSLRPYCWAQNPGIIFQLQVNETMVLITWNGNQLAITPETGVVLWYQRAMFQSEQAQILDRIAI